MENQLELLNTLNPSQREAAMHTEGPSLIIAGAGSGKTKMLISRIAYLLFVKRVPFYNILAVTFTNKAAQEMRQRLMHLVSASEARDIPEIGTFHAICVRILRREWDKIGLDRNFVIYDDSDQLNLIKTVMKQLQIDEKFINPKSVQVVINRAKCDLLLPQDLTVSRSYQGSPSTYYQKIYEHYQKLLSEQHAVDFGEIICLTYRLLKDDLEVRARYQKKYHYVHVDEFQDTNRSQYALLSLLTAKNFGGHENICVVGDEDQSIYAWRGASIQNIKDFQTDYPTVKLYKLEQNYRSTQNILSVANSLIQKNRNRNAKKLWTQNDVGNLVVQITVDDEKSEAETVAMEIKHLFSSVRSYQDFSVFYRTNSQSRQFEDCFRKEKIPYQIIGGMQFYDRKEIKDIFCYFKFILNPSDTVSLKRIINVPARGLGKTALEAMDQYYQDQSGGMSYWEALKIFSTNSSLISATMCKKFSQFVALMTNFINKKETISIAELYQMILIDTGYVQVLKEENTLESIARIENLEELSSLIQDFEKDHLSQKDLLAEFIEQTTLNRETEVSADVQGTVKLMTLHACKGLEFPVVFLVGMEEGLFPSLRSSQNVEQEIQEERRLCYVGMTRAKERLYLLHAKRRRVWGNWQEQEISRFCLELPQEQIEYRKGAFHMPRVEKKVESKSSRDSTWVGKNIRHPTYGSGVVLATEGLGVDQKLVIQFMNHQQKKFLLRYISNYF